MCLLQEFEQHILEDSRSSSLDKGNIKLTYQSVSANWIVLCCRYMQL